MGRCRRWECSRRGWRGWGRLDVGWRLLVLRGEVGGVELPERVGIGCEDLGS